MIGVTIDVTQQRRAEQSLWRSQALLYDNTRLIRDQVFDLDTTLRVDEQGLWLGARRVKTLCASCICTLIAALPSQRRKMGCCRFRSKRCFRFRRWHITTTKDWH